MLARLTQHANVEIGVLTLRMLDDLKAMLALPGLDLAGTSRLELDLRGTRIEHPHAHEAAAVMKHLATHLESKLSAYPGAWLEKKRLALTIHYRQLAGHLLESLQTRVEQLTKAVGDDLRIVQGPMVWEIAPSWGWTKGTAVCLIFADVGATNAIFLYAGDGANDKDAMEIVTAMGGIALGIGLHPPTAAQYCLPQPCRAPEIPPQFGWLFGKNEVRLHTVPQGLLGTVRFLEIHAPDKPYVSKTVLFAKGSLT